MRYRIRVTKVSGSEYFYPEYKDRLFGKWKPITSGLVCFSTEAALGHIQELVDAVKKDDIIPIIVGGNGKAIVRDSEDYECPTDYYR